MLNKILQHVNEHVKKFNYNITEKEKEELILLYEMNHDTYDESSLSLHIEQFMARLAASEKANWSDERRPSVVAKRVDANDFNLPAFHKTKAEYDFLDSMLGQEIPFSFLSADQKSRLIASMYPLLVNENVILIHQGEVGSEMYIIEYGEFDVLIDGVVVNKMFPNSKFGELALLHEIPRTATVRATKNSKVWAAEQTSFSCIRIRDHQYKKKLAREALEANGDIQLFQNSPEAISQALSACSFKMYLAKAKVTLQPDEILIVFKDAVIDIGERMDVHISDIVRGDFTCITGLECGIINLQNIRM